MIVVKAIEAFAVVMIAFILGWALVDWSEVKELRRKAEYYEKAYEQARDHNDFYIDRNKELSKEVVKKAAEVIALQRELENMHEQLHAEREQLVKEVDHET